jgi:hypothetical protein
MQHPSILSMRVVAARLAVMRSKAAPLPLHKAFLLRHVFATRSCRLRTAFFLTWICSHILLGIVELCPKGRLNACPFGVFDHLAPMVGNMNERDGAQIPVTAITVQWFSLRIRMLVCVSIALVELV